MIHGFPYKQELHISSKHFKTTPGKFNLFVPYVALNYHLLTNIKVLNMKPMTVQNESLLQR